MLLHAAARSHIVMRYNSIKPIDIDYTVKFVTVTRTCDAGGMAKLLAGARVGACADDDAMQRMRVAVGSAERRTRC